MSTEAENSPPMQELRRQLDMAQSQLAAYAREFKHTVDELRATGTAEGEKIKAGTVLARMPRGR